MHWIMENHIFRVERQDNLKCKNHFEGSDKKVMDWYYSEDKPLYYTLKSEKAEERAKLLLNISDAMLKQIQK